MPLLELLRQQQNSFAQTGYVLKISAKGGTKMAYAKSYLTGSLITILNYGMVDGKEVIKNKSYGNLRADATEADIMTVAAALNSLQAPTLEDVKCFTVDLIYDNGL
jgi:hypothetical protein